MISEPTNTLLYTMSQKRPTFGFHNFDTREWILIFFWQKRYE